MKKSKLFVIAFILICVAYSIGLGQSVEMKKLESFAGEFKKGGYSEEGFSGNFAGKDKDTFVIRKRLENGLEIGTITYNAESKKYYLFLFYSSKQTYFVGEETVYGFSFKETIEKDKPILKENGQEIQFVNIRAGEIFSINRFRPPSREVYPEAARDFFYGDLTEEGRKFYVQFMLQELNRVAEKDKLPRFTNRFEDDAAKLIWLTKYSYGTKEQAFTYDFDKDVYILTQTETGNNGRKETKIFTGYFDGKKFKFQTPGNKYTDHLEYIYISK